MADFKNYGFGPLPGELLKAWPKESSGELIAPVFLTHSTSLDMADSMIVNMLSAYGIPAISVHPGDGDFGRLVLGISGTGTNILVPETMYEDAKAILEAEPDDELQD